MNPQDIKAKWQAMTPEQKRRAIFMGGGVFILVLAFAFNKPNEKRVIAEQDRIAAESRTALVKPRVKDVSNETLGAELEAIGRKVGENEKVVVDVVKQQKDNNELNEELQRKAADMEAMRVEMEAMRQEVSVLKSGIGDAGRPVDLPELKQDSRRSPLELDVPTPDPARSGNGALPDAPVAGEEPAPPKAKKSLRIIGSSGAGGGGLALANADMSIPSRNPDGSVSKVGIDGRPGTNSGGVSVSGKSNAPQYMTYIPAGSILDGILITGMDAPVSGVSEENPVPALIRLKADAILPNKYKHDVKECFVLVGGKGSLSTERVELRTETLSCITKDGGVIEAEIQGYVTGEDGKVGMRGRLVSKQGALLARSLMAGILSGFGKALTPYQVPQVAVASNGQAQTQTLDLGDAAKTGAFTGLDSAAKQLSSFYLDMAKQTFPLLEVDAGRRANIVLVRGTNLSFGGSEK
jgi:conjugal transfer pilus assembly protein TraB